ncbi:MAG TPA: hypothetical protein VF484_07165 [Candidatus Limnocylindrales bacterium]
MKDSTEIRSTMGSKRLMAVAVLGVTLAACAGSGTASPSAATVAPSTAPAAAFDTCLVGTWTVIAQSQSSPANDEQITYTGGTGEIFTIDANGELTIDTQGAQKLVFHDSAGEGFSATVSGTGKGTLTTSTVGASRFFDFKPSAGDTRMTLSLDSTGTPLGPARPDTEFSAAYTCAPGLFTFYKDAVNYMVDGTIVHLKTGSAPAPATAGPSPS